MKIECSEGNYNDLQAPNPLRPSLPYSRLCFLKPSIGAGNRLHKVVGITAMSFTRYSTRLPQKWTYTEYMPGEDIPHEIAKEKTMPEPVNLHLERVRLVLREEGYATLFDACVDELKCSDPDARRAIEDMKSRDVMAHILRAYSDVSLMGPKHQVSDELCELAERVYRKEIHTLERNREITGSVKGLNANELDNFSFQNAQSAIEKEAPRLLKLFTALTNRTMGTLNRNLGDSSEEQTPDSGNDNGEAWVEDMNLRPLSSVADAPDFDHSAKHKFKNDIMPKKKKLVITVAVCILMHAQSQKSNLMQSALGFYLQSAHCPKEAMTVLHQLGLCVRYETVADAMERIVKDER